MGKTNRVLSDRQGQCASFGGLQRDHKPPKPTTLNKKYLGHLVFGRETVSAWEAVEQCKNRELRLSSTRNGIDRSRRRRKFETPAVEDLLSHTLLGERKGYAEGVEYESSRSRGGDYIAMWLGRPSPQWASTAANSRTVITQGPRGWKAIAWQELVYSQRSRHETSPIDGR